MQSSGNKLEELGSMKTNNACHPFLKLEYIIAFERQRGTLSADNLLRFPRYF